MLLKVEHDFSMSRPGIFDHGHSCVIGVDAHLFHYIDTVVTGTGVLVL